MTTDLVLQQIKLERARQDDKWGEQNHPNGTYETYGLMRDRQRKRTDDMAAEGHTVWLDILLEEAYEAAAEPDPVKLREELVQVAAVATAWIEAIDRGKQFADVDEYRRAR